MASLIGLLDADDQWEPEYLEEMVALANQNPAAAVFYCQTRCMDIDGNTLPQVLGGPACSIQRYLLGINSVELYHSKYGALAQVNCFRSRVI